MRKVQFNCRTPLYKIINEWYRCVLIEIYGIEIYMYSNEYVKTPITFFNKELTLKIWINQFLFVSLHHQIKSYNNNMNNKRIYGFPRKRYSRDEIALFTDVQKEEYALDDEYVIIYDDIEQFLCDINDKLLEKLDVIWTASKL